VSRPSIPLWAAHEPSAREQGWHIRTWHGIPGVLLLHGVSVLLLHGVSVLLLHGVSVLLLHGVSVQWILGMESAILLKHHHPTHHRGILHWTTRRDGLVRSPYNGNSCPTNFSLNFHNLSAEAGSLACAKGSRNWQSERYRPLSSEQHHAIWSARTRLRQREVVEAINSPLSAGSSAATRVVELPSSGVFQYGATL